MNPIRVDGPAEEPVTKDQAKAWCRVEHDADDEIIEMLISAAREACEGYLGRTLLLSTWDLKVDGFPDGIQLPYPRIVDIVHLQYVDTAGDVQTLDPQDYVLDEASEPGWLTPDYDRSWPQTRCEPNTVRVRYRAGWASPDQVPRSVKTWILEHVAHFYRNREASTEVAMHRLPHLDGMIDTLRVWG